MSQRGFVNWRAFGTQIAESSYADGTSVMDWTANADPGNVAQELNNLFTDIDEVTELEEVSETQELSRSVGFTQAQRATPTAIAFFGASAWGQVVTTEVASLAAGRVYRHDIVLTTTPAILPTYGWVENQSGLIREFNGGATGRFAISGERNAHVRTEIDVIGSGSHTDVATVRPARLTAEPNMRIGNTHVWLGTGSIAVSSLAQSNTVSDITGAPTKLDCELESFNYEINNNLLADADSYGFGTGVNRCHLERDQRSQSLSFSLEHDGTSQELQRMLDQTNMAMEIENQSGIEVVAGSGIFYGFNLAFPRLRFTAAVIAGGRGKAIAEITAMPLEQATNTFNQRAAMLTIWNANSGYLG